MCECLLKKYLYIKSIKIFKMQANSLGVYIQTTLKRFNKVSNKGIRWMKFRKMIEFFIF